MSREGSAGVEVAFLRHGRTAWNRAGRLQGRSDIELDAEGRAEIAGFRPPPPWDEARLLASPLARARETAEALGLGAPRLEPRLIEMDLGDWEGRHGVELLAEPESGYRHIEDWGWAMRAPGGEGPEDVRGRLLPLFREIAGEGRRALLVAHMNVMRAALAWATGWAFDGPAPFQIKRNRLYVLRVSSAGAPSLVGAPVRLIREEGAA